MHPLMCVGHICHCPPPRFALQDKKMIYRRPLLWPQKSVYAKFLEFRYLIWQWFNSGLGYTRSILLKNTVQRYAILIVQFLRRWRLGQFYMANGDGDSLLDQMYRKQIFFGFLLVRFKILRTNEENKYFNKYRLYS